MTHQRITYLRLCTDADWGRVRTRVRELAADSAAAETLEDLRLVRIDDRTGVLIAAGTNEAALANFCGAVIDSWREGQTLAEPPSTVQGEVVFRLCRPADNAWSSVDALDDTERREHFVRSVVESGTVWGLYGETWARSPAADDTEALPFWPQRELAARCIKGRWRSFAPRSVELQAFLDQWLVGMQEDGIVAVVLPTPTCAGAVVSAADLAEELRRQR